MGERILFAFVMFLVLGPLIVFCIPEGQARDKFTVFWAKSYGAVFLFGCVAGVFMFVVLFLDKLFG